MGETQTEPSGTSSVLAAGDTKSQSS